jgi:hypothetical protein
VNAIEQSFPRNHNRLHWWGHWLLTLAITFVAGVILLPFLRTYPNSIHKFFGGLANWQRILFIFVLSMIYSYSMYKLFSPRLVHLRNFVRHPPTWLAWFAGSICIACIDISIGLSPNGYKATLWEWAGYGGGAIAVIAVYR